MIRHGDSLTFYLYGYLHDWHTAEDLMIEAFARLMVKRPKIGEGCFKAYLFKTGRNLAYRYHTRKTRITEFSFDDYYEDTEGREMVEEMVMDGERLSPDMPRSNRSSAAGSPLAGVFRRTDVCGSRFCHGCEREACGSPAQQRQEADAGRTEKRRCAGRVRVSQYQFGISQKIFREKL